MLGSVGTSPDRFVVADFEAGIGTMTRMSPGDVDVVVVVVEPTSKSVEVGVRAAELARENGIGEVVVVVNRVRDEGDTETVRTRLAVDDVDVFAVPYDPSVIDADRAGVSPLDHAPDAPAVRALAELADRLAGGVLTTA